MIGHGMKLTAIGVVIGFIGAIAVTHLMSSLLFSVAPTDLVTFAIFAVTLALIVVGLRSSRSPGNESRPLGGTETRVTLRISLTAREQQ